MRKISRFFYGNFVLVAFVDKCHMGVFLVLQYIPLLCIFVIYIATITAMKSLHINRWRVQVFGRKCACCRCCINSGNINHGNPITSSQERDYRIPAPSPHFLLFVKCITICGYKIHWYFSLSCPDHYQVIFQTNNCFSGED